MGRRLLPSPNWVLGLLGAVTGLAFISVVTATVMRFDERVAFRFGGEHSLRRLASGTYTSPPPFMVDLSHSWYFAVTQGERDPARVLGDKSLQWAPFDVRRSWEHAGKIDGHYWMRLEFRLSPAESQSILSRPSIVLGIIPDHHRAYLNGNFIGGTNYSRRVVQYSFDPSLLRREESNTLLVQAFSKRSMLPGITRLPDVGTVLGEFGEVERLVWNNGVHFHIFRLIYLVFTLIAGVISLVYFGFHRREKENLYFGIYLFLGALSLLYYNAYATISLDLQHHRFLKLFSVALSSFVLFSTFCYLSSRRRIEYWNNLAGVGFACLATILMVGSYLSVGEYGGRYSAFFFVVTVYSTLWLLYGFWVYGRSAYKRSWATETGNIGFATQGVILFTATILWLIELSSSWFDFSFINIVEHVLSYLGVTHSFIFSLFVLGRIAFIQVKSKSALDREGAKRLLIADTVKTLSHSDDLEGTISILQERFCQFIQCERSTIYLLDNSESVAILTASYTYGDRAKTSLVKEHLPVDKGLLGKVVSEKKGRLIEDIEQIGDSNSPWQSESRSYRTKSCMLVPLIVGSEMIGVMTLADKRGGPFTSTDFQLIESAAKDLAFILKNVELSSRLTEQIDGIIAALTRMIERRDPYTEFHSQGVKYMCEKLAAEIDYPITTELRIAALMHDIGKLFVPRRVLNKPGKLRPEERKIIEQHSKWSSDVLKAIPGFEKVALWAGLHHETLDGKGYPYNLTSDLIPFEAQIISVADFIDALSTNRSYRPRYSFEKVEEILGEMADKKKFAPQLVEAGKRIIRTKEFRKYYSERSDKYRADGGQDQATFDYYEKAIEEFRKSIEEFVGFMDDGSRKLSKEKLQDVARTLATLKVNLEKIEQSIYSVTTSSSSAA